MNVAELIKALQEVPDQSAAVTVDDTAGANLDTVDVSAANASTPASDGPESSNASPDPGTVDLVGAA